MKRLLLCAWAAFASSACPRLCLGEDRVLEMRLKQLSDAFQSEINDPARYRDALVDAEKFRNLTQDPGVQAGGWARMSEAYYQLKESSAAESCALEATALNPRDYRAWEDLARIRNSLGKYKEAADNATRGMELRKSGALNRNDARIYRIRAEAYEKLGDAGRAAEDRRTAERLGGAAESSGKGAPAHSNPWGWLMPAWAVLIVIAGGVTLASRKRGERRSPPSASQDPPADGRLAGKYELLRVIGRGGMGEVYEAFDHSLGRTVAVKKMSSGPAERGFGARELYLKEARTVAALRHPAIVDIYEVLEADGNVYLVFELVRGKTVQQLLVEHRRLSPERTLEILRPVCEALECAHGRGLVHRDLKPSNIMVTERGDVKLMDFGIARSLSATAPAGAAMPIEAGASRGDALSARTMTIAGTPQYMAPEAEAGVVRKEGDVFSLGVCLYEMLTGRAPFPASAALTRKADMDFPAASAVEPGIPVGIDALIADSLRPDPDRRLGTPAEFLARFEAVVRSSRTG